MPKRLEAEIFLPLDVRVPGQLESVFDEIRARWDQLDFLVHSIAFSPKEALQGRVIDVEQDGFSATLQVSCWSFIRMAHLAEAAHEERRDAVHDDLLWQSDGC